VSGLDGHADLAALRKRMRNARRALTAQAQARASALLLQHIRQRAWFRTALNLGFYVADDGEADPAAVLSHATRRGRACFLPVLPAFAANSMRFANYDSSTPLVRRRFGIVAPRAAGLTGWRLDVVFLPLVAFDRYGRRLGRGGGFYDRAFAARPGRPRPLLVGLAHELQEVPQLPRRDHDVHLDIIVTPNEVIEVQPPAGSILAADSPRRS
jgi:5-formyltetrahydrofolate cyclo-ligase